MASEKKGGIFAGLTFTTLLTVVFLVATAIAAAYVWGVMSGRNSKTVPSLPVAEAEESPPTPVLQPGSILKAQELEFAQVLRGEPVKPLPKPVEPEVPAVASAPPATPAISSEPAATVPAYSDYVFQIAALKDEQAADALRQQLEGRSLRTRMERSGRLFLVLVLLRGDEARCQEVFQAAHELRLGAPLLRSRKPVTP